MVGLAVVVIAVVLVVEHVPPADVIVLAVITLALPAVHRALPGTRCGTPREPWCRRQNHGPASTFIVMNPRVRRWEHR